MDIDSIIKALTKDALYTYEFDVTIGIAEKDHTGETTYDVTYRRRNDSDHCHDRQCLVEDIQESKEAGMNEHISQPLDITKVLSAICKYIKNNSKIPNSRSAGANLPLSGCFTP